MERRCWIGVGCTDTHTNGNAINHKAPLQYDYCQSAGSIGGGGGFVGVRREDKSGSWENMMKSSSSRFILNILTDACRIEADEFARFACVRL